MGTDYRHRGPACLGQLNLWHIAAIESSPNRPVLRRLELVVGDPPWELGPVGVRGRGRGPGGHPATGIAAAQVRVGLVATRHAWPETER